MSLYNIQLPPIILQKLFKYSLVDLKTEQNQSDKMASKEFILLGNNRRNILILVECDDTVYLPDEELTFLLGVLAACNLTMEDVAILNIKKNESATYKTITSELSPQKIFLFGVNPIQIELPVEFPNYQIQQYNNQVYLTAPLLSFFKDNKAEKIKLWNCLKQIFAI
jgi:hypothetical protein